MKKRKAYFVYLLKQDDTVVYVGCTQNLKQRMSCHMNKIHNNVELFKYDNRPTALSMEGIKLAEYMPKYNYIPSHLVAGRQFIRLVK